jgi:hypothetical protein
MMLLSQCMEYFCVFLNTPCFEILLLPLFWRGWCFTLFLMLFDRSTIFSMLLEHILFLMTPLSFLQEYKKRNLFELWSIYFWWMDGMFCVTPGVGVSMYMWVYVISIMEAWKDSTKGHNNLAKLNGSEASICRRFMHWYRHMTLVGNMTIEELVLFYFQKEIIRDFTILWDRACQHCRTISY